MRSLKLILDAGLVLYGIAAVSAHWHVGSNSWPSWADKPSAPAIDAAKPGAQVEFAGQRALASPSVRGDKPASPSSREPALR